MHEVSQECKAFIIRWQLHSLGWTLCCDQEVQIYWSGTEAQARQA